MIEEDEREPVAFERLASRSKVTNDLNAGAIARIGLQSSADLITQPVDTIENYHEVVLNEKLLKYITVILDASFKELIHNSLLIH